MGFSRSKIDMLSKQCKVLLVREFYYTLYYITTLININNINPFAPEFTRVRE